MCHEAFTYFSPDFVCGSAVWDKIQSLFMCCYFDLFLMIMCYMEESYFLESSGSKFSQIY